MAGLTQLSVDLTKQRRVAFDDPTGNLFVVVPRGVLDKHPAVGGHIVGGRFDGLVVVGVELDDLSIFTADRGDSARVDAACRHEDASRTTSLPGEPGYGTTVVSIRGGDHLGVGVRLRRLKGTVDGPRGTECLERGHAQPGRLVLGEDRGDPEFAGELRQFDERGGLVAVQCAVEVQGRTVLVGT